jgi:hypothetical protein
MLKHAKSLQLHWRSVIMPNFPNIDVFRQKIQQIINVARSKG